ncbi:TetR/AcrR family transcriptional regulator [Kribbella antibiotica]|uniref:TetR/AcrR family transcriptional regulator n=1 Tax=Kribbella antibiotica TaxID=190195 RepID=A0A4R4Z042_9ACTN|nr:helix-turn-helix domain-containing protein [Kribbella antibiotica]TDD49372.1 TetR/AcrR family transcriptional regulator [Kribbella antibiotica]
MAGVRQFDEDTALQQALDVFWERGWQSTSMVDLAAGTGVQRGSLYHAYGGKEQIFLKAFDRFAESFLSSAATALAAKQPLNTFFDYCIDSITSGRGCFSTRTAVEADAPAVRAAVQRLLDDLEELLIPATGSREAARLVVTTTRGLAVLERVYGDPERLRATARTLVQAISSP